MEENNFTKLLRLKSKIKISFLARKMDFVYRILFSCDIPSTVKIGYGTKFAHGGLGCVIHPRVQIGSGCKIFQHVTIGSRNGSNPPTIGDGVYIGAGACIIGEISIGKNVRIGANSVVLKSVSDGCTIAGVPARIIKHSKEDF